MGLNHKASNVQGWQETLFLMAAFEAVNKVSIRVCFTTLKRNGEDELYVEGVASTQPAADVEPVSLASVRFAASAKSLITLQALVTHCLYELDYQLGAQEFERVKKQP